MDNKMFENINYKMKNLCTSTPNDSEQINKQISRPSSNIFRNLASQFSLNDNNMSYQKTENDNWNYTIEGPCYVDFSKGTSKIHETYFDSRESLGNPLVTIKEPTSPSIECTCDSIIGYLKDCSISKIEKSYTENTTVHQESSVDDIETTLIPNPNSISSTTLNKSKSSCIERRHSSAVYPFNLKIKNKSNNESTKRRQSTIVHPFSFELREKGKQELKQERLQYKIAAEQLNTAASNIKSHMKFKAPAKLANEKKIIKKGVITKPVLAVKPCELQSNVMCVSNSNTAMKCKIQLEKNNSVMKTGDQNKVLENNVPQIHPNKKEIKDVKPSIRPKLQKLEPWKRKPFQVLLPKRQLTIAHSPKLKTAERAESWKLHEKRMIEKEKRDLEERNKRLASEYQRQKEEISKIRKQTVHKAIPIPHAILKRSLAAPINQLFIKRSRRN